MEIVWNKIKADKEAENCDVPKFIVCPQCGTNELAKVYKTYVTLGKTTTNYIESDVKMVQGELEYVMCPTCKVQINF